jgi:spore coat polysaccharide biosynthesis protein SpsF
MDQMIEHHMQADSDLTHCASRVSLGTAGEVISFAALKTALESAKNDYQREHVTPFIYEQKAQFKITSLDAPDWLVSGYRPGGGYRLTIDEKPDLEMFEMLLQELKAKKVKYDLKNAIALLNERPDIAKINETVIQKNWRHPATGASGAGGSDMPAQ